MRKKEPLKVIIMISGCRLLALGNKRNNKKQTMQCESGFLLLEVLLAVTILAVALTTLLQSIIQSIDSGKITREYSKAMYLTSAKMWELKNDYAFRRDSSVGTDEGNYTREFSEYDWITEVEEDPERVVYKIRVTTKWIHSGKEKKFILESMVPFPRTKEDYE